MLIPVAFTAKGVLNKNFDCEDVAFIVRSCCGGFATPPGPFSAHRTDTGD